MPAADCNFTFDYIAEGNKKFPLLRKFKFPRLDLSLVKKGMITMWVGPHLPQAKN